MANRVTGMISGLDTESLVKQMMALSQSRYDNIMKKKTETEWKKQLYDDIHKQLKSFDKQLFDASLSNFNAPKTATSTNESIATVTAGGSAANVSHTLIVKELASGANLTSSGAITKAGGDKNGNLGAKLGLAGSTTVTLSNGNDTKTFEINDTMTMSDLVKKINDSGLGIKATYDSNNDRLFLNSTSMGESAKIDISATNDTNGKNLVSMLNLGTGKAHGTDAEIILDGTTFKQDKNDFTIAGLNFSLKSKSSETIMVNVKADTSKIVDNVKGLVKAYNDLVELINGKTSEKYYRDYSALTDEQKKEMSDKEIELWEEKAKSGLLRNDSILTGLTSKMRTAMYSSYDIDGKFKTMSSIGISTSSYQDKGKLTIDEEKLAKALEEDPDAVSKLFSKEGGLIDTLRGNVQKAMRQMEDKAGAGKTTDTQSPWAKEIKRYTDQMESLAAKMVKEENRYYSQFTSLEKTLSSMNSNSSYLTSMLGS